MLTLFFPLTFCSWAYYIQSSNQHFSQETCCSCHCLNLVGSSLDLMQLLDTILYWQRVQNNYIKVTHRQHAHPLQGAGTRIYTQKTLTQEFLHTYTFYIQKFLQAKKSYREVVTYVFYTQAPLHIEKVLLTEAFTQRSICTKKSLHTETFRNKILSTERKFVHTHNFCLHPNVLTQRIVYTEKRLQKDTCTISFTHKHKRFYREKPLHRAVFTHIFLHRNLCTKEPLRTQVSTQGNPSTHKHAHTSDHTCFHLETLHAKVFTRRSVYQRTSSTKKTHKKKTITRNVVTQTNLSRVYTHLLRNIFANSDVECILRAKTLH